MESCNWCNNKPKNAKQLEIYKPKILCYKYNPDHNLIKHYGNVYGKLCIAVGAEFNYDNAYVNVTNANQEFCDYVKYVGRYVFNSRPINKCLLTGNVQQIKKSKPLLNVMEAYAKIYGKVTPPSGIAKYYIFHVGRMMFDENNTPCINTKTFKLKCFLSCSLTILSGWLTGDCKVIYEIEVDIKQPVFFLFDNTEQMECLLPPGTELKVVEHKFVTYCGHECCVVKMKLTKLKTLQHGFETA